jgi:chromosome partitioning protein
MRRIALANLKGGSGKTTTATALAVGLASAGHRTLFVDADPSANGTWTLLGGQGAEAPTLAAVLTREASAAEAIRPATTPGLDLLPADAALGAVNVALAQQLGRDVRLRAALAAVEGAYRFVVLDTGPTLTTLLVNALAYAAEVLVPVDCGVYGALGLVGLEEMLAEVREAYNPALRLAGLVLTRAARNNVCRDVERELRGRFGPLVSGAVVPLSAKVEEAHSRGTTVLGHAPGSAPALAYSRLVSEVLGHGGAGAGAKDGRGGKARRAAGDAGAA